MKIIGIELTSEEEDLIFKNMTDKFNLDSPDIFQKGQEINFPLTSIIEVWSKMELFREYSEPDENNQSHITNQCAMMSKFELAFFIDGEEIKVNREKSFGKCLEDRIEMFYHIAEK
jgi:hypothetical protein